MSTNLYRIGGYAALASAVLYIVSLGLAMPGTSRSECSIK
jgi:hypothetical protein